MASHNYDGSRIPVHVTSSRRPSVGGLSLVGGREDHRRVANGEQVRAVTGLAMRAPVSVDSGRLTIMP